MESLTYRAFKIAERIHLLASGSLGTGMSHPNDCNVCGIDCGGEFVLIDAGVGRETETIIENLLSDGIQLGQVQHLFLTHGHLDHSGGAAYFAGDVEVAGQGFAGNGSCCRARR